MRASDRIRDYVLLQVKHPDKSAGSRLPTIAEVTSTLQVGRSTVQSVFHQLAKEGLIHSHRGRGTFLISKHFRKNRQLRIAISVPFSRQAIGGLWAHRIGGGIFNAAFQVKPPATLVPLPEAIEGTDAVVERLESERSEVDGLILFPYSLWPLVTRDRICAAYEKAGKPVVHLYPPTESATANFVSFDYFEFSRRIAETWRKTGRTRLLYLTPTLFEDSISVRLRHAGFVAGVGPDLGSKISLQILEMSSAETAENGARAMRELLQKSKAAPDAIYSSGDQITLGAVAAIREQGLRIPEDVSVFCGSSVETDAPAAKLTHAIQPLERLGGELLKIVCERIQLDGVSLPGRILPMSVIVGDTTRPEENVLLAA